MKTSLTREALERKGLVQPAEAANEQKETVYWFAVNLSHSHLYEATLRQVEPILLRLVLLRAKGNLSAASRHLGINRVTLRTKLQRYGIEYHKQHKNFGSLT